MNATRSDELDQQRLRLPSVPGKLSRPVTLVPVTMRHPQSVALNQYPYLLRRLDTALTSNRDSLRDLYGVRNLEKDSLPAKPERDEQVFIGLFMSANENFAWIFQQADHPYSNPGTWCFHREHCLMGIPRRVIPPAPWSLGVAETAERLEGKIRR